MRNLVCAELAVSCTSGVADSRQNVRDCDAAGIVSADYECEPFNNPKDRDRKYEVAAEMPKPTPRAIDIAPNTVKPSAPWVFVET